MKRRDENAKSSNDTVNDMLRILSLGRRGNLQRLRIRRRPRDAKKYDNSSQNTDKEVQHQRRRHREMAQISR